MIEYRLVCGGYPNGPHRHHVYNVAGRNVLDANRDTFLASRNNDPAMTHDWHRACVPWRIEQREIGDWETVT